MNIIQLVHNLSSVEKSQLFQVASISRIVFSFCSVEAKALILRSKSPTIHLDTLKKFLKPPISFSYFKYHPAFIIETDSVQINPAFFQSIKSITIQLKNIEPHTDFHISLESQAPPDESFDSRCLNRFHNSLVFLLPDSQQAYSHTVQQHIDVLMSFFKTIGFSDESGVSSRGFQFLLSPLHVQVDILSSLLIQHCSSDNSFQNGYDYSLQPPKAKRRKVNPSTSSSSSKLVPSTCELLRFYFTLVQLFPNCTYKIGQHDEFLPFIQWLDRFGLVKYLPSQKQFIPTSLLQRSLYPNQPMLVHPCGTLSRSINLSTSKTIVVETNFSIFVYDPTILQRSILSLFVKWEYALPNILCGIIARTQVLKGYSRGIRAATVIQYLEEHLHPRCASLPQVVCEQLISWEKSSNRIAHFDFAVAFTTPFPDKIKELLTLRTFGEISCCVQHGKVWKMVVICETENKRALLSDYVLKINSEKASLV